MYYRIKKDKAKFIKEKYKSSYIAKVTGITDGYISQVFSGKKCKKKICFAICQALDKNFKIEDFFEETE